MKFIISSTELLAYLLTISKVINSKNTISILENFLFSITGNKLKITGSDLEVTLCVEVELENVEGEGKIAIPVKYLIEPLKLLPDQPLSFVIDRTSFNIDIQTSDKKKYRIPGQDASEYPKQSNDSDDMSIYKISPEILLKGVSKTIFAIPDNDARPIMCGVFAEFEPNIVKFVAADSHTLVKYENKEREYEEPTSFLIPRKAANLLKAMIGKSDEDIVISKSEKILKFDIGNYVLFSRRVEGNFPNYNSVIPTDNPIKVIINRLEFINSLRRIQSFASASSLMAKIQIENNEMTISAQDIDFAMEGEEKLSCNYDGELIEIGFKSPLLIEILSNLSSESVLIELSDATRPGLVYPLNPENENEKILMLIVPMMLNSY